MCLICDAIKQGNELYYFQLYRVASCKTVTGDLGIKSRCNYNSERVTAILFFDRSLRPHPSKAHLSVITVRGPVQQCGRAESLLSYSPYIVVPINSASALFFFVKAFSLPPTPPTFSPRLQLLPGIPPVLTAGGEENKRRRREGDEKGGGRGMENGR